MTTEHVTHRAAHARYEGEAQARLSASAVLYHPEHFFSKLWIISQVVVAVALTKKSRHRPKQQRSDQKRQSKAKLPVRVYFLQVAPS